MLYTVKAYLKDGRLLFTYNTVEWFEARCRFISTPRVNKEVGRMEFYYGSELQAVRENEKTVLV
jgi:hypothetical protein